MTADDRRRPGDLDTASAIPIGATHGVTPVDGDWCGRASGAAAAGSAGRQFLIGVRMLLALTVILGVVYPLAMLGIGRLMPDNADGSMIELGGTVVGSELIGQRFTGDQWFVGRPSAAGGGYDPLSSGGTNLSADSEELAHTIAERRAAVAAANGVSPNRVPADAVTSSASGLDPHISPAYAHLQVPRVARARGLEVSRVERLVTEHTARRILGFLGEERVNVLQLNLALQRLRP